MSNPTPDFLRNTRQSKLHLEDVVLTRELSTECSKCSINFRPELDK